MGKELQQDFAGMTKDLLKEMVWRKGCKDQVEGRVLVFKEWM